MSKITLDYPAPFIEATLLRRYRRFLSDVMLPDGSEAMAYCPNTGRIPVSSIPGSKVRLVPTPHGKYPYKWVQTLTHHGWAGIDTMLPNRLFKSVFQKAAIPGWGKADLVESEVVCGDSRFDFRLHYGERTRWVEVKSVTWFDDVEGCHLFPDSVSERATKHLETLKKIKKGGEDTAVIYAAHHPAQGNVRAAEKVDVVYAKAAMSAKKAGVEFRAFRIAMTDSGAAFTGEELIVE